MNATGYGSFQMNQQPVGAKPSTSGGAGTTGMPNSMGQRPIAQNRMNQTLYTGSMRQKNLSFNRNNIANIYLNKKGQAVQVQLKNQQQV